jgi:lantibiotic transport system permease protein
MNLILSLRSEIIKCKRTSLLYFCVLAAVFIPIGLVIEAMEASSIDESSNPDPLNAHFIEGQQLLNFIALPMYIILTSTLLLQMEYRNNTWKQVLSSPQKISHIFFAKYLMLHVMIFAFFLLYFQFLVITAVVIDLINPALDIFSGDGNFSEVLFTYVKAYISILGISAIQFWLALRSRNFILPVALGFSLWFISPLLLFEFKSELATRLPFSLPIATIIPKFEYFITELLWYSVGYCVLFLGIAYAEFSLRRVRT